MKNILHNLLISLPYSDRISILDFLFSNFVFILLLSLLIVAITGTYRGYKSKRPLFAATDTAKIILYIMLLGVVFFLTYLYFNTLNVPMLTGFIFILLVCAYLPSCRLGRYLKKPGALIICIVSMVCLFVLWIAIKGVPSNSSLGFGKERLRGAYKSLTGSGPDAEAKREDGDEDDPSAPPHGPNTVFHVLQYEIHRVFRSKQVPGVLKCAPGPENEGLGGVIPRGWPLSSPLPPMEEFSLPLCPPSPAFPPGHQRSSHTDEAEAEAKAEGVARVLALPVVHGGHVVRG
jgi:hypothetical protein